MAEQVTVVLVLHVKPGLEELLLEKLRDFVRISRKESGCLFFDVYREAEDHASLILHEVWRLQVSWEQHRLNVHTARFYESTTMYLDRPIREVTLESVI